MLPKTNPHQNQNIVAIQHYKRTIPHEFQRKARLQYLNNKIERIQDYIDTLRSRLYVQTKMNKSTTEFIRLEISEQQDKKEILEKQRAFCKSKNTNKQLDIAQAKQYPISQVLTTPPVRTVGGRTTYHCPFHEDKTASFTVYNEQNSFFAYCCQKGGDSIALYQLLNDCNFPTAVKALTNTNCR